MDHSAVDRRGFLGALGAGSLGAMLAGGFSGRAAVAAAPRAKRSPWKPVSDRKVRVGIVGYGYCRFGAKFGFQDHPNVEVVAVSDLFRNWNYAPATAEQKACLAALTPDQVAADELAGEAIMAKLTRAPGNGASIGGLKVVTASGWFAARPSGTEDIYKIYAESFQGSDHLRQIQDEARQIISAAFDSAGIGSGDL